MSSIKLNSLVILLLCIASVLLGVFSPSLYEIREGNNPNLFDINIIVIPTIIILALYTFGILKAIISWNKVSLFDIILSISILPIIWLTSFIFITVVH